MQECTLQVEGCRPVYQPGVCCPVRYDCGKSNKPVRCVLLNPCFKIQMERKSLGTEKQYLYL